MSPRAPYMRTPLPRSGKVEDDMARVEKICRRIIVLASAVRTAYPELHEAGHWGANSGSVSVGRSSFEPSDPTGDVVASQGHANLRAQVRSAASEMKGLERILDRTEKILKQAFPISLDAEMREKLARVDETARDYSRRHRRPA